MNTYVDCSRLSEGLTVKNYKEMCVLLKEKEKSGASKRSQIKQWKRYFDFEKEGQKFFIERIYDAPLDMPVSRRNRNGIYYQYIKLLILDLLAENENKPLLLTRKELCYNLGMINFNYLKYSPKMDFRYMKKNKYNNVIITSLINDVKQAENISINRKDIAYFYFMAEKKLNSILHSSLNAMAAKSIIQYEDNYFVYANGTADPANYEQLLKIQKVFNEVFDDMGVSDLHDAIAADRIKEFYHRVDNKVQCKYGWQSVFSKIKITASSLKLEIMSDDERNSLKANLNKGIIDYFERTMFSDKNQIDNTEQDYMKVADKQNTEMFT